MGNWNVAPDTSKRYTAATGAPDAVTCDAATVGADNGVGAAGVSTVSVHNPNAARCCGAAAIDTDVVPPA